MDEDAGRLRPVLLRLARELRREIHSLGVTGGQVSLLASIKHNPGITATELSLHLPSLDEVFFTLTGHTVLSADEPEPTDTTPDTKAMATR